MDFKRGIFGGIILSAIISLLILFSYTSFSYLSDVRRLDRDMITLEERMSVKSGNWVHYLEGRVNGLAQRQDEYQTSTSKRIDYLQERINKLETQIESQQKQIRDLQTREKIDIANRNN